MKRIISALVLSLALASCTQMQRDESVACANALYAARVYTLAELSEVAQTTPACIMLGLDAWQRILAEVAKYRGMK